MMAESGTDTNATLATANRILAHYDVLDGFGHVSMRDPVDPNRFLLSRNMASARVTPSDIMEFGLDGEPIDPQGRSAYLERFIHSSVYKSHPDVHAVIHSHSPSVIPFGVTKVPLRAIYHMGAFLGEGVPVFEIRDKFGDATSMLITNAEMGDALADDLGANSVVLMRGHGNVVVAPSLKLAVFRAVYTELNARLEAEALSLGGGAVNFLTRQECETATKVSYAVVDRAWDLWIAECRD